MVVCTHTSVVTPAKIRCVIPLPCRYECMSVAQNAPLPGLWMHFSPSSAANSSISSFPYSPRTKMRPISAWSPMRLPSTPRSSLDEGQFVRHGVCASSVCTTSRPLSRARLNSRLPPTTEPLRLLTSLPREHPNPPGNRKSRWKSMKTTAVCLSGSLSSLGIAGSVTTTPGSSTPLFCTLPAAAFLYAAHPPKDEMSRCPLVRCALITTASTTRPSPSATFPSASPAGRDWAKSFSNPAGIPNSSSVTQSPSPSHSSVSPG
mmetsp:Transcript_48833/g.156414  ORF Transcript_48833/g.156414 Transcript_48833/m.156414 type:complete len:261 (+) Transcript_48833:213-995(+)